MLTQDLRMATQPVVIGLLREYRGLIFCLDSAELPVDIRASRFDSRRAAIWQMVRDKSRGFYVVHETGRPRRRRGAGPE